LDFDGPVCSIFADMSAPAVAGQLRNALQAAGFTLPDQAINDPDPLEVFRTIATTTPAAAEYAQAELTRLEVEAVYTARATRGASTLITYARVTGRTVTIVTNNSSAAVNVYLDNHRLTQLVARVVGRDDADPERMKPNAYRVREAMSLTGAKGEECAFVGDTVTDVVAGRLAGVAVIGFANKPGKASALTEAGADAVVTRLSEISAVLRAAPCTALPN
jgi:phosphoglycolate phosphatase-like HAD superfamily hydrolase